MLPKQNPYQGMLLELVVCKMRKRAHFQHFL